jgi:hypothetical protein
MVFKIIFVLIILLILFFLIRKKENFGVFGHRATLNGIKHNTQNFYLFNFLKDQFPYDYWTEENKKSDGVFDRDVKKNDEYRFSPKQIQ